MDSKKDGLPPAVSPVLPPGRTDWTVRNTDSVSLNTETQLPLEIANENGFYSYRNWNRKQIKEEMDQ